MATEVIWKFDAGWRGVPPLCYYATILGVPLIIATPPYVYGIPCNYVYGHTVIMYHVTIIIVSSTMFLVAGLAYTLQSGIR